jgi:hypothetical protein
VLHTVSMAPNSQPGDLAHAKGKLYVAEEFGAPLRSRSSIPQQARFAAGSRSTRRPARITCMRALAAISWPSRSLAPTRLR